MSSEVRGRTRHQPRLRTETSRRLNLLFEIKERLEFMAQLLRAQFVTVAFSSLTPERSYEYF